MASSLRSSTGCYRCRQRRIKCDENRPTCGACTKHHFNCTWPCKGHRSKVWPSQSASKDVYTKLLLQRRYGQMKLPLPPDSTSDCPVKSISAGYPPLKDQSEHRLFVSLASFLKLQAVFTTNQENLPKEGFEFTVALQEPWLRSSILSMAALIAAARGLNPITVAFEHYGAAVQYVRPRLLAPRGQKENEELLIAALFLGLMDTNIVENQIHPSPYYLTVGRILTELDMMETNLLSRNLKELTPALWFRRISYESYLHQMAGGAFRHPKSYKSIRLVHPSMYPLGGLPSSVDNNALVPLDYNCFFILYEISRLHHSPRTADTIAELQFMQIVLQDLQTRYQEGPVPAMDDFLHSQFKVLTCTALGALQVFCAKAIDPSLTPSSLVIQRAREFGLSNLKLWFVKSLWPGFLSWIPAILLCAAETEQDVRTVCAKIDEFLPSTFSANLDPLRQFIQVLNGMQGPQRVSLQQQQQDEIPKAINDSLALMFLPQ